MIHTFKIFSKNINKFTELCLMKYWAQQTHHSVNKTIKTKLVPDNSYKCYIDVENILYVFVGLIFLQGKIHQEK